MPPPVSAARYTVSPGWRQNAHIFALSVGQVNDLLAWRSRASDDKCKALTRSFHRFHRRRARALEEIADPQDHSRGSNCLADVIVGAICSPEGRDALPCARQLIIVPRRGANERPVEPGFAALT